MGILVEAAAALIEERSRHVTGWRLSHSQLEEHVKEAHQLEMLERAISLALSPPAAGRDGIRRIWLRDIALGQQVDSVTSSTLAAIMEERGYVRKTRGGVVYFASTEDARLLKQNRRRLHPKKVLR